MVSHREFGLRREFKLRSDRRGQVQLGSQRGKRLGLEKRTHSQRVKNSIMKSACLRKKKKVCVQEVCKMRNEKFQS